MANRLPEYSTDPENKGSVYHTQTDTEEYSYRTLYINRFEVDVPKGYYLSKFVYKSIDIDGNVTTHDGASSMRSTTWSVEHPEYGGREYGILSIQAVFVRDYTGHILRNSQGIILRGANGKIVRDA